MKGINRHIGKRSSADVVCLDFQKRFGKVFHQSFLKKLDFHRMTEILYTHREICNIKKTIVGAQGQPLKW